MVGLIALLQALTVAVSGPATSPEYLPLRVAAAEGYFTREGLDVTLRTTRAEVGAAEAFAQRQADLVATSLEAMLRFGIRAGGAPPRLVFGLTAAPPVALLAGANPAVAQSVARLAGLRVGLSAPGVPEHTWLLALLARAGVKPAEVEIVSLGARALPAAIESGEVQAGIVAEPVAVRLVNEGRARLLADLRTPEAVVAALGGPTVSAAIFGRADGRVADGHLAAFLRALLAAEERIRMATPDALAASLPAGVVGAGEDFPARLEAARGLYLPGGEVSSIAVRDTLAIIRDHMPLPATLKVPRPDDLLHLEPLRRAGRPPKGR